MTLRQLAPPKTYLAAFLAAFSIISSELLLLRILSGIRIGFTLASFFIYAGAILGLGLGNFLWLSTPGERHPRFFRVLPLLPALLLLAVFVIVVFSLILLQFISRSAFFDYIMICMYVLYPFFVCIYVLFGYALAHILNSAARSGSLLRTWACDIGGSAVGGVLPIVLVGIADPLILYFLPVLAALLLVLLIYEEPRGRRAGRLGVGLAVLLAGVVFVSLISPIREFDLLRSAFDREYDRIAERFKDTFRGFFTGDYRMEYIGWSPYRKLNYVRTDGLYGIMYDNLGTTALITEEAPPDDYEREELIYSYPQDLTRVLIIGAGAGPQVRFFAGRADSLIAVELDPLVVKFALSHADEAPYLRAPGVNYLAQEGLSYLRAHPGPYSLILYPLTDSFIASSMQSLVKAENYLYTVEGLRAAVGALDENGLLLIHLAESMNEYGLRAAVGGFPTVAVHAYRNLLGLGIDGRDVMVLTAQREAGRAVFVLHQPGGVNRDRLLELLSNEPQLNVLTDSERFLRTASTSVGTTNDRPFFYIPGRVPPAPVREAATFLLITSLAAILLVVCRAVRSGVFSGLDRAFTGRLVAYAACTGFGFMTVETVLIQRIVPMFGAPYLAGTVVIAAMLLGAGLTSFLLGLRHSPLGSRALKSILAVTVLAVLCLPMLTECLSGSLASLTLAGRIAICCALFLPLGLLLGVPFPSLLERARTKGPTHVVLAYATDVSLAIIGIVVSLVLPIVTGYAVLFYLAAAAYAGILSIVFSFGTAGEAT